MTRVGRIAIAVGVLSVASFGVASDERSKWWQSDQAKSEIGLTNEQSRQLERIFQETLPRMRSEKNDLDRQEQALSKLMNGTTTTEAEIAQAIDGVEAARARAAKTRLLMLYRMYHLLTPDQRQKLTQLHEQRRHGGGNPTRHH